MPSLQQAAESAGVQPITSGTPPTTPTPSSGLSGAAQGAGVQSIIQRPQVEPQPETSLSKNIGTAFEKRVQKGSEILDLDQSFASDFLQLAGQGAGFAWDIMGEAFNEIGRGVSKITPDVIEKPIKENVLRAFQASFKADMPFPSVGISGTNTPLGISLSEIIEGSEEIHESLKENHPTLANNLEAIVNLGGLFAGGRGAKVGTEKIGAEAGVAATKLETGLATQALDDAIKITKPKLTTKEKSLAISQERGTVEGLTKTPRLKPSPFDKQVAESVKDIVDIKNNPFKNVQLINEEIKNISLNNVEQNLLQNNAIFNRNQLRSALGKSKESSKVTFGTEKTLERNYDAVIDAFMLEIEKQPKTLAGLWQARKNFDNLMEDKFGPGILSNPVGDSARKNAIRDVRRTANDFIENKLPDDISYKRDMQKMSNMYRAVDNISEKAASSIDKDIATRVKDAVLKHPVASTLTGTGLGLGLASGALYSVLANPLLLSSVIVGGMTLKSGQMIINSKTIRQGLINTLRTVEKALQKNPKNKQLLNDSRDISILINQIDESSPTKNLFQG